MQFHEFTFHERLQRAIEAAGYDNATPIQREAMPVALAGNDLVGTAQTGTGKTAAFVLPMLQRLLTTPPTGKKKTRALVLCPTRELAEQIHASIRELGRHTNIRSATVYGGVGYATQQRALGNGTEIIVACPGRLLDHIARGHANLDHIEYLVLDEADRMLDMGFMPPIKQIIKLLPEERQTMLFSATFAKELNTFVDETLREPVRVEVDTAVAAQTVSHAIYPVTKGMKTKLLIALLRELTTESVLIFTRTKHVANQVSEHLNEVGFDAGVLHSNKSQNQRQATMERFRSGAHPILVATDIAARGIDVATISHVINFDIPETAEDYIHRIGRTGRAERSGQALTLVTIDDLYTVRQIERLLGQQIETCYLDGIDYQPVLADAAVKVPEPKAKRTPKQRFGAGPARKSDQPAKPRRQHPPKSVASSAPTQAKPDQPAKTRKPSAPRPMSATRKPAAQPATAPRKPAAQSAPAPRSFTPGKRGSARDAARELARAMNGGSPTEMPSRERPKRDAGKPAPRKAAGREEQRKDARPAWAPRSGKPRRDQDTRDHQPAGRSRGPAKPGRSGRRG